MHRLLLFGSALVFIFGTLGLQADERKDSPKAAETRKKLKHKIKAEYEDARLDDVVQDIKSQIKGLGIRLDTSGGVSRNIKIKFTSKEKLSLEKALDGMFQRNGLGYIVTSKEGDAYDGTILIRQGKERGYPVGEQPKETVAKDKKKGKEKTTKTKPKAKEQEKTVEKKKADKEEPADAEKLERDAARKFTLAKALADAGKTDRAKERLKEIVDKFPKTKAADSAKELLKKLEK